MKSPQKQLILFFFLFILGVGSFAQTLSLDQFDRKKKFSSAGGINFRQDFYSGLGGEERRNPYTYFLSGNINASLFGFSFPFSFSISNQQVNYRQPFNQLKITPKYKWVSLHLGNSNMNWSPLTLAGHSFNGYGIDLTPKKFNLSAMYGTLLKAVEIDTTNPNTQAAYKRVGYGLKFGTKVGNGNMDIIFFGAKDDANSIQHVEGYDGLNPQENVVLSIKTDQTIKKNFSINLEVATSAIKQNANAEGKDGAVIPVIGIATGTSTAFYTSVKSNVKYNHKKFTLGVGYERIAPEYKTFGAYFFNNNFENITLNGSTNLFKKKVSVSTNLGLQRDNLDDSKISSMTRFVGAINLAYAVNKKLKLSGSYSNFLSSTIIRPEIDAINPLLPGQPLTEKDFTQLSHNANINASYQISTKKEKAQSLNVNLSQQTASNQQNGQGQNSGTKFYNLNVGYNLQYPKLGTLTFSLNGNQNQAASIKSTSVAPGITLSKPLFKKKLQTSFGATYNSSFANGISNKSVFNLRLNMGYVFKKAHNFTLSTIYLTSKPPVGSGLNELTVSLNYGYNFTLIKAKK